ncbi:MULTISPECIES: hypothetical protein [Enterobacter cloacae complex]|uniref:hypothetical protein n=1 Tax=Enterobacter cloacae complex TaxID=354276 RepID=UPI0018C3064D|nr:hypothetical protein [Enterobacter roggenkampii]HCT9401765.1 hypothetical protein [Enterobacter hormaechei]MBG0658267.1 hypothetical protein [Enterobacter roggenkampii]MCK6912417.1 hypothetical protein [Enterobacter roggenkampii]MCM7329158.1 hypothetical protein [Enterobacter roggenkampii]MDV0447967.1 hypothetical protein [Enterobacter roggenkampii]
MLDHQHKQKHRALKGGVSKSGYFFAPSLFSGDGATGAGCSGQLDYYKSVVRVAEALSMLQERFAGNQYCFERDRYHDKRTIVIGHYLITSSGANGSY